MSPQLSSGKQAALEHAVLVAFTGKDGKTPFARIEFDFNPTDLKTSRTARWEPTEGQTPKTPSYLSSGPQKAELSMFLDEWSNPVGDVSETVNKLISWTKPTAKSVNNQEHPTPPVVTLEWGRSRALSGVTWCIESVNAEYTLFRADGCPIRANCRLSLREYSDSQPEAQNPTSGSLDSRRTTVLAEGDSLPSLAYREYGDASLWRALAVVNRIDDPLSIAHGTSVLLPPAAEAHRLESGEG